MRLDTLPSTIIFYVLLLTTPTHASVDVDFSAYPASAQSCLTLAVDTSGCSSESTVSEMNDCLCGNSGDFVLDSARCLGSIGSSAGTMSEIGVITSSIAGAMTLACITCMIIFFTKRKKDKLLLAEARAAAAQAQAKDKDQNRGLLSPGAVTPGLPSPAGPGGVVSGHEGQVFGASVVPPTPIYTGPAEAQAWRGGDRGLTDSPSELNGDSAVFQLYGDQPQRDLSAWPSPLTLPSRGFSQGLSRTTTLRSESSWAPSPASAYASSNALGMYSNGTAGASRYGADSVVSSPILARQGTNTSRTSWAHDRPYQEELYELPGMEARSPVEADSNPIMTLPESTNDTAGRSTPPEYSSGGWVDPNTDKPPL
ncbi:hypothetical protein KVR01_013687 [Diaporthe batatas]|uniref:uncharacterized protein n=1 Tax=Diaporthe batatas TaxID=748121 RepID=UPI001D054B50|nr:uncharacterized protein KVR01_013687 [Diaporthe batatas]KAG8156453.1 hypothetical protein KVR01_013687 [Diaporthe batatas]